MTTHLMQTPYYTWCGLNALDEPKLHWITDPKGSDCQPCKKAYGAYQNRQNKEEQDG